MLPLPAVPHLAPRLGLRIFNVSVHYQQTNIYALSSRDRLEILPWERECAMRTG